MSLLVTGLVWKHADVGKSALLVLLAMADIANDDGTEIWPSVTTLAAKARCDVRQVTRATELLEKMGFIEMVERHNGRAGHYKAWRINLEAVILSCPDGLYGAEPRARKVNKTTRQNVRCGLSTGQNKQNHRTFLTSAPDIFDSHIDNSPRPVLEQSYPRGGAAPEGAAARVQWEKLRSRFPAKLFFAHLAQGVPVGIEGGVLVVQFDGGFMRSRAAPHAEAITKVLGMPVRFDLTPEAQAKMPRRA